MIGFLRGEILENNDNKLLLLTNGVGYAVSVPQSAEYGGLLPGKNLDLYIYTHVREDALDLFGFSTKLEKDLFLSLLSVNGIGPKVAMGILSRVESSTLINAILEGDKESLTQIPGIGKKTAERVVLELADPIRKKVEAGILSVAQKTHESRSSSSRPTYAGTGVSGVLGDAKAALIGLGYREHEVTGLLNRIMAEMETPPGRAEDLVRTALRQLV